MRYTEVKAVQDESSHWYVIPNQLSRTFYELEEAIIKSDYDNDLINDFEQIFSKYMTGGDLNNVQLYIKEE